MFTKVFNGMLLDGAFCARVGNKRRNKCRNKARQITVVFLFLMVVVIVFLRNRSNSTNNNSSLRIPTTCTYASQFLWTALAAIPICFVVTTLKKKQSSAQLQFSYVETCTRCNLQYYHCSRRYSSFGGLRSFLFSRRDYRFANLWTLIGSNKNSSDTNKTTSFALSSQTPEEKDSRDFHRGRLNICNNCLLHHSNERMVKENSETNSACSVSSKEAEMLISILAFDNASASTSSSHPQKDAKQINKPPVSLPPISTSTSTSARKSSSEDGTGALEPATLIYHESARSIVFRDHLRRSYNDTKKSESANADTSKPSRQTGTFHPISEHTNNLPDYTEFNKTTPLSCTSQDDETIKSNESGSKRSKSSYLSSSVNHSRGKNRKDSASVADSQHSVSSNELSIQNDDRLREGNQENVEKQSAKPQIVIANYTPAIEPLPAMELGAYNEFTELLQSKPFLWEESEGPKSAQMNHEVWNIMNEKERDVVTMILHQKCVVKTVKKADWTAFLNKFVVKEGESRRYLHPAQFKSCSKEEKYKKYSVGDEGMRFNSFMTSTSLLPTAGLKMRCFGSTKEYCLGVVFPLPTEFTNGDEDAAVNSSKTWCWPSGYAAKTEFNISQSGDLINGREEALVSISSLRSMNHNYLYEEDYEILGSPYNEVYLRVGGEGRIFDKSKSKPSFDDGVGLPIALFARSATYGELISLLRTKRRMSNILGDDEMSDLPLLYITPDHGVHVITDAMQAKLLHIMTNSLNPFQNPTLQYKTEIGNTSEKHLQQKIEELFDLDDDKIREVLTPEDCARLAGGFGATDDSVAHLLMDAMIKDFETETDRQTSSQNLQKIVNEGLTSAVRSGDFNTSRQLLILYTLVASRGQQERDRANSILSQGSLDMLDAPSEQSQNTLTEAPPSTNVYQKERLTREFSRQSSTVISEVDLSQVTSYQTNAAIMKADIHPPPPPPPLDTDRLRSATNSDGLLAVLGAAEVLKSMQNEAAQKRAMEAIEAVEEWIDKSENSVTYRLAHWRDLTAAQGDLKIATEEKSHLWHFVSNKAIHNRRRFVDQLRESVAETNFESITFLKSIHDMVSTMNSPCLRLELLQFILGLDNRYSVAHVARSVELAATCLNISAYEALFTNNSDISDFYSSGD